MVPWVWATAYDDSSHKESVQADVSAFYAALPAVRRLREDPCISVRRCWSIWRHQLFRIYLFHRSRSSSVPRCQGLRMAAGSLVQVGITLVLSLLTADLLHRSSSGPRSGSAAACCPRWPACGAAASKSRPNHEDPSCRRNQLGWLRHYLNEIALRCSCARSASRTSECLVPAQHARPVGVRPEAV